MDERLRTCTVSDMAVEPFLSTYRPRELAKENPVTRAWIIETVDEALFVKWVPTASYPFTLAKDVAICRSPVHFAIVPLLNLITLTDGMLLIFPRIEAEPLADRSMRARFFDLPLREKLTALRTIFAALVAIIDRGWVMEAFNEGNVLYHFATRAVWVFGFEHFHRGTRYRLEADRSYGSSRLRSPEETVRGCWIDQRSNLFTLGRYAICALSHRIDERWREGFQGSEVMTSVLERATQPDPHNRFPTAREFLEAFESALP